MAAEAAATTRHARGSSFSKHTFAEAMVHAAELCETKRRIRNKAQWVRQQKCVTTRLSLPFGLSACRFEKLPGRGRGVPRLLAGYPREAQLHRGGGHAAKPGGGIRWMWESKRSYMTASFLEGWLKCKGNPKENHPDFERDR